MPHLSYDTPPEYNICYLFTLAPTAPLSNLFALMRPLKDCQETSLGNMTPYFNIRKHVFSTYVDTSKGFFKSNNLEVVKHVYLDDTEPKDGSDAYRFGTDNPWDTQSCLVVASTTFSGKLTDYNKHLLDKAACLRATPVKELHEIVYYNDTILHLTHLPEINQSYLRVSAMRAGDYPAEFKEAQMTDHQAVEAVAERNYACMEKFMTNMCASGQFSPMTETPRQLAIQALTKRFG